MMRLHDLLVDLPDAIVHGDGQVPITAIVFDSRQATPGCLFVALRGGYADGHRFVAQAVARGAVATLVEEPVTAPGLAAQAIVGQTRAALARVAATFYGHPSQQLGVIGVTGTDGKTTTTYLLDAMLTTAGLTTGLMGTIDTKIGAQWLGSTEHQTTPESLIVQERLHRMVGAGVDWALVESTSHGLALHRLDGVAYDIAVLTNVTHEHLEFHKTFEHYREAKASLFRRLATRPPKPRPQLAVINADDPSADYFAAAAGRVPLLRYSLGANPAEIRVTSLTIDGQSTHCQLQTPRGTVPLQLQLIGEFNVANALAAAAVGIGLELPLEQIAAGLGRLSGVPGRLERIDLGQPFLVVVDYAHTPESMAKVLRLLRPLTPGRLICLFGSAGERDVAKRAIQGRVSAELADLSIITSEDPRFEDATAIVAEIAAGGRAASRQAGHDIIEEPDRMAAIHLAVGLAQPGDTLMLAGKGHEQSIIIGDVKHPWDDREAARTALRARGWSGR